MKQKSKIAAGLLAFFTGCFGVHNFYLGNVGKAIFQLVLGVMTYVFLIPAMILTYVVPIAGLILSLLSLCCSIPLAIWIITEGICILTGKISCDAKGIPLK